jgi:hypothetical protein
MMTYRLEDVQKHCTSNVPLPFSGPITICLSSLTQINNIAILTYIYPYGGGGACCSETSVTTYKTIGPTTKNTIFLSYTSMKILNM